MADELTTVSLGDGTAAPGYRIPTPDELAADQKVADELAAGLRVFADMLQANPHVAADLRVHLKYGSMHVFEDAERSFPAFIRAAKAHGATIVKDYSTTFAKVRAIWSENFSFALQSDREQVCERVVVGTREVTEEVPDPEALAAVPTTTVTRTEEIVEWECRPLLAGDTAGAS